MLSVPFVEVVSISTQFLSIRQFLSRFAVQEALTQIFLLTHLVLVYLPLQSVLLFIWFGGSGPLQYS